MKVWVNGSFDVMHVGHIKLLEYASKYGTVRVGLDSDERIRERKGENRPFNSLKDRMDFISSIKYVESVTSFGNDDELVERIKEYDPDIMVIGNDYKYKPIIGCEYIERILFFDKIENKSTSLILNDKNTRNR